MKYQKSSHVTYDVRYHLVWITKYRKPVLTISMQERLHEIFAQTCEKIGVVILNLWFEKDHVHMYVRLPITKSITSVVGYIKWKSSYIMRKEFYKQLKRAYWWVESLWAVRYFISSVWEINWEIIAKYVEQQWKEENEVTEIEL
jgi:putative transposase